MIRKRMTISRTPQEVGGPCGIFLARSLAPPSRCEISGWKPPVQERGALVPSGLKLAPLHEWLREARGKVVTEIRLWCSNAGDEYAIS